MHAPWRGILSTTIRRFPLDAGVRKMRWLREILIKLGLIMFGKCRTEIAFLVRFIYDGTYFAGIVFYNTVSMIRNKHENDSPQFGQRSADGPRSDKLHDIGAELEATKSRLKYLEDKFQFLSSRVMKPFPDVKYLNYRNKKRILVRLYFYH